MADEVERATEEAQRLHQSALDAARGRVPDPSHPGPRLCPDCEGNEIPQRRRELGYQDCVECAQEKERRNG